MKPSDVVNELKMEMAESQNERDARVEQLWKRLDDQGKGELDWKGLQRGLKKIDHPLKNADNMLKGIIKVVDTDGDGKIQYEEFRVFVEAAERQLFQLFQSIDHDNNGKLDKQELQAAFHRAGLAVPNRRLDEFFVDMDHNRDGFISYEEWRNFLLFMPNTNSTATMHSVFTFYSEILTLSAEGDSVMSEKSLEGIGTTTGFFLSIFFGSIIRTAFPTWQPSSPNPTPAANPGSFLSPSPDSPSTSLPESDTHPYPPAPDVPRAIDDPGEMNPAALQSCAQAPNVAIASRVSSSKSNAVRGATPADLSTSQDSQIDSQIDTATRDKDKKTVLINYIPDPGYFIAGAVAGGISRTATAPLDRLKVYLLVNTKPEANVALDAAKKGRPVLALKNAGRPLLAAVSDLYKSGGARGFFAGNGLNVVKIMPETAIRFGAYEAAKNALAGFEGHNDPHSINPISKFVAGGAAGMAAQFCVYPLDTLKFRLQSEYVSGGARGNALLFQTARKMLAEGGVRAAYRGVTMGLIGMFPYSAIDMGTFELLKVTYIQYKAKKTGCHEEDAQPSTFATGIMGASSGAFGASVVYPLNVLRTRLQTQGTSMHPARYTGIWDVAQKTIKNEGFRGLYKGLMPNLLKVAPALSITWMVYENTKKLMHLH
ncbi:mitochondrial carrier domain-containing protein [Xylaria palmicola]|nr:mitochondrial carrier domain-containing protein [Xylaria palmicola]